MATNHQRDFDQAIKRPGRFDLLLCIAPPKWAAKKDRIELFCDPADADAVRDILTKWFPNTDAAAAKLDVFTFDEIKALFEAVRRKAHEDRLSAALAKLGNDEVRLLVDQWHEQYITLRPKDGDEPNPLLVEFEADRKLSHLQ
jgi:SpoVK/Ycf46/Vps4 family AAA+-type ATPase